MTPLNTCLHKRVKSLETGLRREGDFVLGGELPELRADQREVEHLEHPPRVPPSQRRVHGDGVRVRVFVGVWRLKKAQRRIVFQF